MSSNESGSLAVLVGGQYGSEGKGAIARHLADRYQVHIRVGSPNAGHTIWWNGKKHVMQTIPCGWVNPNATIIIGRGALINMDLLQSELLHIEQYYPHFRDRLLIDAEAGVLDRCFWEEEGGIYGEMHRRIGSTGEGVGPARMARIARDPSKFRLFKDAAASLGLEKCVRENTPELIALFQDHGLNVLVEGTQGSALSLYHSYWPYCTSTDTNASGIIAEVGIPPMRVTDVIMVCRTYPIRVAGNSGPLPNEISWDMISKDVGHNVIETTTVTHKVRRVAKWDDEQVRQAMILNMPTQIAITFADYIDPELSAVIDEDTILESEPFMRFIYRHFPDPSIIKYVSTGPDSVADMHHWN